MKRHSEHKNARSRRTAKIERIKAGWCVRLRCGQGQHHRFRILLERESDAQRRADQMVDLVRQLVAAGRAAEAPTILRKAGRETTEAAFAEVASFVAKRCNANSPDPGRLVTFRELAGRWTSGELARDYPDHVRTKRSVEHDVMRLTRLCTTVGDVPLRDFRLEHARAAMAALPSGRTPATRRHYAQLISKVLKLAVYPCELIDRFPLPPGFLPKIGQRPALSFLYPAEFARVMACEAIPFPTRVLYGFLAIEGCRLGEALELRWRHLDLEHGTIRLERTKTGESRAWALRSSVALTLTAFRGTSGADALVFADALSGSPGAAAKTFREHLVLAGVDRAELFERTQHRRPIRLHDLRSTFVTLALANGRPEAWVQDRTGHTTSIMLSKYRRQARHAAELGLGALPELNEALPDLARVCSGVCNFSAAATSETGESAMIPELFRCRDSNSDSGIQSPLSYP